jgi:hypothetical protein
MVLGRRDCIRRGGAAVSSLALVTGLLAGCSSGSGNGAAPNPGHAPAIGPAPTASLPPATHESVRVVPAGATITASSDLMWGADRQIGPAYRLGVATEPRSAVISFRVNPAKLAAAVGVPDATTAGLYIQVFEPSLGSWIPLASTYHPASQTVTATAPHLSLLSLTWTEIKCAVTCPAKLLAKIIDKFTGAIVANIKDAFPPKQDPDQCTAKADKQWSVQSSIAKLSGCVIDSGTAPEAEVENPMLLPVTIRQPSGAPRAELIGQPYLTGKHLALSALVTGLMDWASGATLIGPRDYGALPLQDLTSVPQLVMATQPDALALVMDVIQGVLFALPGEKSEEAAVDDAIKTVLPEFEARIATDPESVSLSSILTAVEDNVARQEAAGPGPVLTVVRELLDAYTCADTAVHSDLSLDSALGLAKDCAETALKAAGTEAGESYAEAASLIDDVSDFVTSVREGVQFAELGPSAIFGRTVATRAGGTLAGVIPVKPCGTLTGPRSAQLPPSFTLPPGSLVYGTSEVGVNKVTLSIAPAGFTCTALQGGDGSFVISLIPPGAKAAALSYGYSSGGAGINLDLACGYFPELKSLDAIERGGTATCTPPPKGELIRQFATGDSKLLAATTTDLPGTLPAAADPSGGQDEAVGVVMAYEGAAQEADCVLPASERAICAGALTLFADQSLAAQYAAKTLPAIDSALSRQ